VHEHPQFAGLLIHDDTELGATLGAEVASRRLVHEWPLTRTEEVQLTDGRRFAYKAQLPPSVEPEFYRDVMSPLLARFVELGRSGRTTFIATEWIDAPTLHDSELADAAFVAEARRVVDEIAAIRTDAPTFLDLSTGEALAEAVASTTAGLSGLIDRGRFDLPADAPDRIRAWGQSPEVFTAATSDPRICHGDLSPEEVFLTDEGIRIIDWQRTVRGPSELDLVSLLRFRAIDPLDHVAPEFVQLFWFILLHWAVLAQTELLPDFPPALPEGWARMALAGILT
jgi:hypothetical protein